MAEIVLKAMDGDWISSRVHGSMKELLCLLLHGTVSFMNRIGADIKSPDMWNEYCELLKEISAGGLDTELAINLNELKRQTKEERNHDAHTT